MNTATKRSPWLIWSLAAAFFLFEYITRVTPSVIAPQLMQTFNIYALGIGTLSALFYYPYIGMQLPVGMLVDRFGPHRLLSVMALVCAAGSFLFATATHIFVADIARFMIGFGAAFAFVGSLKLATAWFSPARFALLAGLTQALGMLGASLGEGPMAFVVKYTSWRHAIFYSGLGFLLLAVLIAIFVRDKPQGDSHVSNEAFKKEAHKMWAGLSKVVRNPKTWVVAGYAGFIYASSACFGELWGVSYLKHVFHLSNETAASAIGLIFIGWAIGAPIMGYLASRMSQRFLMIGSALCGMIIFIILLTATHLSEPMIFLLTFLYGLTNTGLIIAYTKSGHINGLDCAGTSMAFANMASVIIGAVLQPVLGWVIDLHWSGKLAHGIPVYTSMDFRNAATVFPVCLFLAAVLAFFGKRTFQKDLSNAR